MSVFHLELSRRRISWRDAQRLRINLAVAAEAQGHSNQALNLDRI